MNSEIAAPCAAGAPRPGDASSAARGALEREARRFAAVRFFAGRRASAGDVGGPLRRAAHGLLMQDASAPTHTVLTGGLERGTKREREHATGVGMKVSAKPGGMEAMQHER